MNEAIRVTGTSETRARTTPITVLGIAAGLLVLSLLGCHQECATDEDCFEGFVCVGSSVCPDDVTCVWEGEPGFCGLPDPVACTSTGGTWDESACGHSVCGEAPDCTAVIPGCDCGPHATFIEGRGCFADPNCPCRKDADCGPEWLCEEGTCISMCMRDDECGEGEICHDDGRCGDPLQYYVTCGDPVCRFPDEPDPDVPPCGEDVVLGEACGTPGSVCDAGLGCGQMIVCAAEDPRMGPGGCPISRREFKRDVTYLDAARVDAIASELVRVPLATWNYTQEPATAPPHLGFILEDVEPSPGVDSARDRVDLYGALSMAVAGLQSQQRQIDALRAEVRELKAGEGVCRESSAE